MYYITALQGAAIVAAHSTLIKVLVSFTLRTYQYLEWDVKRRSSIESNKYVIEFQKAQANESEYAALIVAILLYLSWTATAAGEEVMASSLKQKDDGTSIGATLVTVAQVAYVWVRTVIGYPKLPTILVAVTRYVGLGLITYDLCKLAFLH